MSLRTLMARSNFVPCSFFEYLDLSGPLDLNGPLENQTSMAYMFNSKFPCGASEGLEPYQRNQIHASKTSAIYCTGATLRSKAFATHMLLIVLQPFCPRSNCSLSSPALCSQEFETHMLLSTLEPNLLFEVSPEIIIRNHILVALDP